MNKIAFVSQAFLAKDGQWYLTALTMASNTTSTFGPFKTLRSLKDFILRNLIVDELHIDRSGSRDVPGSVISPKASVYIKSYIQHIPGHQNSRGEIAEYVIKSHDTDKIIQSYKTKEDAEKALHRMRQFSGKQSGIPFGEMSRYDEVISPYRLYRWDLLKKHERFKDMRLDETATEVVEDFKEITKQLADSQKNCRAFKKYLIERVGIKSKSEILDFVNVFKKISANLNEKIAGDFYTEKRDNQEFTFDFNGQKYDVLVDLVLNVEEVREDITTQFETIHNTYNAYTLEDFSLEYVGTHDGEELPLNDFKNNKDFMVKVEKVIEDYLGYL